MKPTVQQQEAIDCQDRALFIQAGAGTGKTATLSKRIGRQLEDGSVGSVQNLMIITFTNKAAGELLGRIRAELRSRGLVQDALRIDEALISTIHAMCTDLLNEHALEADIDPGAVMLSEEDAAAMKGMALESKLSQRYSNKDVAFLLGNLSGMKEVSSLINKLLELQAACDCELSQIKRAPKISNLEKLLKQNFEGILSCKMQLQSAGVEQGSSGTIGAWQKFVAKADRLESLLAKDEFQWAALKSFFSKENIGPGNSQKEFKPLFESAASYYSAMREAFECALKQELLDAGLRVANDVYSIYKKRKKDMRVRDLSDLPKDFYNLLAKNPEIVKQYRDRFATVMVDEFQDTDPLQVGIILNICDESLKTLTTVGDAQQAIYGFRGADIETYRSMRSHMIDKGALVLNLDTNFRSHPDILHFVKAIFEKDKFFGQEFLDIGAGRTNTHCNWIADDEPRVRMHFVAGHKAKDNIKATSANDLFAAQAELIASQFEQLAAQGVPYGEMAVLLRSNAKSEIVAQALRRYNVPCVVCGGQDYFTRKEIVALVYLLSFLELCDDDEVLLKLLASPLFDLSDDCLLELGLVQHRIRKENEDGKKVSMSLYEALLYQVGLLPKNLDDPLVHAKQILQTALSMKSYAHPTQIIDYVVHAGGLYATLQQSGVEGTCAQANIAYFGDLLQDYLDHNNSNFCGVAQHFRNICELADKGLGGRGKTSSMIAFGNDAVQIMTIHASKGLEFSVVATIQGYRNPSPRSGAGDVQILSEGKDRYFYYPVKKSLFSSDIVVPDSLSKANAAAEFNLRAHEMCIEQDLEESQRLFYVALTRARDMLIYVTGTVAYDSSKKVSAGPVKEVCDTLFEGGLSEQSKEYESSNGSKFEFHYSQAPFERDDEADGDDGQASSGDGQVGKPQDENGECNKNIEHKLQNRAAPLLQRPLLLKYHSDFSRNMHSYSSLAKEKKKPHVASSYAHLRSREDDAETVSTVGSAFHQVACWIVENNLEGEISQELLDRTKAAARRWKVSKEDFARLEAAIKAWLASTWFKELKNYKQLFAEYVFCVPAGDIFLEGSIDLLCLGNNFARVIDYKTGTSGEPDELQDRYKLQASVYAYSVLSAGLSEEVELVFLRIEDGMKPTTYMWRASDLDTLRKMILS